MISCSANQTRFSGTFTCDRPANFNRDTLDEQLYIKPLRKGTLEITEDTVTLTVPTKDDAAAFAILGKVGIEKLSWQKISPEQEQSLPELFPPPEGYEYR